MSSVRSLTLVCLLILIAACDKIDQPVNVLIPSGLEDLDFSLFPGDPDSYPVPEFSPMDGGQKKILFEEYTGHKCTNCPPAAALAEEISEDNPGRIVLVSVHASTSGDFQATSSSHPTDFTTEAGDTYVNAFPLFIGNPHCTIDRVNNSAFGSVWHLTAAWEERTADRLDAPLTVNLQMELNYYPETNGLFVHTFSEAEAELEGDFVLILYLLRDEVVSPQSLLDGTVDDDYVHKHVLTDNINGTWGTPMGMDTLVVNEGERHDFSYALPDPSMDSTFEGENLTVVGFIVDRDTEEVHQAVYRHLVP